MLSTAERRYSTLTTEKLALPVSTDSAKQGTELKNRANEEEEQKDRDKGREGDIKQKLFKEKTDNEEGKYRDNEEDGKKKW